MESIITPLERLQHIQPVSSGSSVVGTEETGDVFKDFFTSAYQNVVDTDNAVVNDTELLATGDVDDLHTLSIDNMKATLAVNMMVQIRNRALESYNQIMQISV